MLNRKNSLFNNYKKTVIKLRIKLGSNLFNHITKNQSGFCQQLTYYIFDEINQAFDSTKSFEALDISRAFDKVWHDGLIFKLEQNGISGNLLRHFQN